LFSLVVLCVCLTVNAQTSGLWPVLFASPTPAYGPALQNFFYRVPICSSISNAYDGQILEIRVNLPFVDWKPDNGLWIQINAYEDPNLQTIVCTNQISMGPTCSFVYSKNMTDIFLNLVGPARPGITFLVNAQFPDQSLVSPTELPNNVIIKDRNPEVTFIDLNQFFRGNGSLLTDPEVFFQTTILTCPPSNNGQTSYVINAAVSGLQDTAGFTSYLCLPNGRPCNPVSYFTFDGSGAAFNTLGGANNPIPIADTNLTLQIYGYGPYEQLISFQLDVSISSASDAPKVASYDVLRVAL